MFFSLQVRISHFRRLVQMLLIRSGVVAAFRMIKSSVGYQGYSKLILVMLTTWNFFNSMSSVRAFDGWGLLSKFVISPAVMSACLVVSSTHCSDFLSITGGGFCYSAKGFEPTLFLVLATHWLGSLALHLWGRKSTGSLLLFSTCALPWTWRFFLHNPIVCQKKTTIGAIRMISFAFNID